MGMKEMMTARDKARIGMKALLKVEAR